MTQESRTAEHIDMLMADVERLRAERDLHYTRLASLLFSGALDNVTGGQFRQWEKEDIDAKAERDALRADAKRYRWLLSYVTIDPDGEAFCSLFPLYLDPPSVSAKNDAEQVSAAIDAAMQRKEQSNE